MYRSDLLREVSNYILNAVSRLDRLRYAQESAYVDAFLGRLDGTIDLGENNGILDLKATVVADRGRGAAENVYGADFALIFESIGGNLDVKKAILAQAKNRTLENLSNSEMSRLNLQCQKMAAATAHYFVLEAPLENCSIPTVRLGIFENKRWSEEQLPFDEYLVDQVISCMHGDRRKKFIKAVGDSKLSGLRVLANGVSFEPDPPRRKLRLGK
jgi:hypothetical protein